MDSNASPPLFDHDLDVPRESRPALSEEEIGRAQRVVVNPMLAILGWLVGLVLIRLALRGSHPGLFWMSLLVLLISSSLIQFHCLDCGTTGWIASARRHACPSVERRVLDGGTRGLAIGTRNQIRAWAWFLGIAALCYLVFSLASR